MNIEIRNTHENIWELFYPEEYFKNRQKFYEADRIQNTNAYLAEVYFRDLIKICPHSDLDSYLHLGLLKLEQGDWIEGISLITRAYFLAKEAIPSSFMIGRDRIPWIVLENRPFLRVFTTYGIEMLNNNMIAKAIDVFEDVIFYNPTDNQGVRYLLASSLLRAKKIFRFFELEKNHAGEDSPEFVYGSIFANYSIGNEKEAVALIEDAKVRLPFIHKEFKKKRHFLTSKQRDNLQWGVRKIAKSKLSYFGKVINGFGKNIMTLWDS